VLGRIEAPGLLDGGDVLLAEGTAYVGTVHGDGPFTHRSNAAGRRSFAEITGLRVIEVPVSAKAPRLSSVATIVDASTVVLGADHVDAAPFEGMTKIVTPLGEEFAAGMFVLAERKVVANLRFRETPALLKQARIVVESLDLWEFGKLGYGPAALALPLARK
jgi:dimethylargininase